MPVPVSIEIDETLLEDCPEPMRPGDQKTFDGKRAAAVDPAVKWKICADRHKRLAIVIRPLATRKQIDRPTPLVGQPVEPVQPRKSWLPF